MADFAAMLSAASNLRGQYAPTKGFGKLSCLLGTVPVQETAASTSVKKLCRLGMSEGFLRKLVPIDTTQLNEAATLQLTVND